MEVFGTAVPNYQGMFLRGLGRQSHTKNNGSEVGTTSTTHASGALGTIQGDAIRNVKGRFQRVASVDMQGASISVWNSGGGAFYWANTDGKTKTQTTWVEDGQLIYPSMDLSRMTPTASEIRPVNIAVKYIIKARWYPEFVSKYGSSVPDYRGMFLRGLGSQSHTKNNGSKTGNTSTTHASGTLGTIQGDASRNIKAILCSRLSDGTHHTSWGSGDIWEPIVIDTSPSSLVHQIELNSSRYGYTTNVFNASRIVPTANENRPVNKAVKYIVKARWYPELLHVWAISCKNIILLWNK